MHTIYFFVTHHVYIFFIFVTCKYIMNQHIIYLLCHSIYTISLCNIINIIYLLCDSRYNVSLCNTDIMHISLYLSVRPVWICLSSTHLVPSCIHLLDNSSYFSVLFKYVCPMPLYIRPVYIWLSSTPLDPSCINMLVLYPFRSVLNKYACPLPL